MIAQHSPSKFVRKRREKTEVMLDPTHFSNVSHIDEVLNTQPVEESSDLFME
jgi:hypothetical protein